MSLRSVMAEVDGNRTRRTRITRPNRFEGGGVHQALGHLRGARYLRIDSGGTGATRCWLRSPAMKKIILLVVLVGLVAFAATKVKKS